MPSGAGPSRDTDRTFVVAARARAAAIFYPGEHLTIDYVDEDGTKAQIAFKTRFLELGFETAVPEDLWVHAIGSANSLDKAVEIFTTGARDIAATLGLVSNSWMGVIEPEVAYESTTGLVKRDFWQRLLPQTPITAVPSRKVDTHLAKEFFRALEQCDRRDRLRRASSQYHAALERWTPGSELLAVAHLFMAMEALKPVAVEASIAKSGKSKEELANDWGFKADGRRRIEDFLLSEVRRNVLFEGDEDCHRRAKGVSDGFEHGFVNSGRLFDDAVAVAAKTARYVRKFILTNVGLAQASLDRLLDRPYETPCGPLSLQYCFRGLLEGEGDALAPAGSAYPIMDWRHRLEKVMVLPNGTYGFCPKDDLTARLGDGIKIRPTRFELWGNQNVKIENAAITTSIVSSPRSDD